jgi:hypothetical protein
VRLDDRQREWLKTAVAFGPLFFLIIYGWTQ